MNKHEELFDYAPFLQKIQHGERDAHELILSKKYEEASAAIDEIVVNARMAKAWLNMKIDELSK